jgi:hypothetical protein
LDAPFVVVQPIPSDGVGETIGGWGFALVLAVILAIAMLAVIASFAVYELTRRHR